MKSIKEINAIIGQAIGSEAYHAFSTIPGFPVITDGVLELAKAAECFWLLDVIGSHQLNRNLDPAFQVWKLTLNHEDKSAAVRGYNDTKLVTTQHIPYSDFPLDEVKLYLCNGVIMLPSEY
jgi:hypothetical protein